MARRTSSSDLRGQTCVVTGASSGIGRELAMRLASVGATVCAVARRGRELEETARQTAGPGQVEPYVADLVVDRQVWELGEALLAREGGVQILVHSAGTISRDPLEKARIQELDRQWATNVRAPYLLTQILLPELCAVNGQIVFINSSAGLSGRANFGQFAATQHALRAIADSLRDEVNRRGVRVLSVYPGRTATPRQARIHALEARPYFPERLVQPGDVATLVVDGLTLPRTAELTDIAVRPMLMD